MRRKRRHLIVVVASSARRRLDRVLVADFGDLNEWY